MTTKLVRTGMMTLKTIIMTAQKAVMMIKITEMITVAQH